MVYSCYKRLKRESDMINKLAVRFVEYLITNGAGHEENREAYVYGIEIMVEKIITYTALISIATYLNILIPSSLFVMFFILLRGYTGGYHANTYIGCLVGTITMYLTCTLIVAPLMIHGEMSLFLGLAVTVVLILLLSPVNHPNLDMDSSELMICKKRARIVLSFETVFILVGSFCGIDKVYIVFPFLGMVMCAFLVVIAKILKQEVKVYEEGCVKGRIENGRN